MRTNSEICKEIGRMAPLSWALPYDNVGLQIGEEQDTVNRVLLSLDASDEAISEAVEGKYDLLITHHPLLFHPINRLTSADPVTRRALCLWENRVSLISMHTNLDAARGGVNDCLAAALGLHDVSDFENEDAREGIPSIGRIGYVQPVDGEAFAAAVVNNLRANGARFVLSGKPCHKIAVGGGACADYVDAAYAAGCDTLVTADVKYKHFNRAMDIGINLIDAGHYATEYVVIEPLAAKLRKAFPDVEFTVSRTACDPVQVISNERI